MKIQVLFKRSVEKFVAFGSHFIYWRETKLNWFGLRSGTCLALLFIALNSNTVNAEIWNDLVVDLRPTNAMASSPLNECLASTIQEQIKPTDSERPFFRSMTYARPYSENDRLAEPGQLVMSFCFLKDRFCDKDRTFDAEMIGNFQDERSGVNGWATCSGFGPRLVVYTRAADSKVKFFPRKGGNPITIDLSPCREHFSAMKLKMGPLGRSVCY